MMTVFIALWLLSLAVLIGIVIYARLTDGVVEVSPADSPSDFRDFIATELTRMNEYAIENARRLRPHGERVITTGGVFLKKGHTIFVEKVIGRIEVKKGNAVSFFLKRIAEHQEALRQKAREEIE